MNNLFSAKKLLVVVASCMLSTGALWADVNPKPFVVPELKTWTGPPYTSAWPFVPIQLPSSRTAGKNAGSLLTLAPRYTVIFIFSLPRRDARRSL